ncbi:uncharacterized protein G2W53_030766 [Senna tora]|uniref:Uncharacterized protein n=1 Tax=Senna tora TaxID=362788 RepID=A0A834T9M4_9FABA|nr:uncharacterized protein G2W53_030766 [Senna tora]
MGIRWKTEIGSRTWEWEWEPGRCSNMNGDWFFAQKKWFYPKPEIKNNSSQIAKETTSGIPKPNKAET